MLQSNPTKKGTGIEFWGDYGDLENLHTTIHKIAERLDEGNPRDSGQFQLLMSFAYDLRKSFEGFRLKKKFIYDSDNQAEYFGFSYLWTDLLYLISALRFNAAYVVLDELDQANLFLLEHCTKKALREYDPKAAEQIQRYIGRGIEIHNDLVSLALERINIEFLSSPPGKRRFNNLPNLLKKYSPDSPAYKLWKTDLEKNAKRLNCEIHNMSFGDYPEFEW